MSKKVKKEDVDFKKYLNFYKFSVNLPGSGDKINFKPVSTYSLKKLLSYSGSEDFINIEEGLDELIESCVLDDGFCVDNLYLEDRFFLLLEIRKKSKGKYLEFTLNCPNCGSQTLQKINLDEMKVKKLDLDNDKDVVKLDENISLRMSPMTRKVQKEAIKLAFNNTNDKDEANAEATIISYANCIKEIITPDGVIEDPSEEDKMYLMKEGFDFMYERISEWFRSIDFGLDLKYKVKCLHCNEETESEVPVEDFFY